jgi:hypothetical protein
MYIIFSPFIKHHVERDVECQNQGNQLFGKLRTENLKKINKTKKRIKKNHNAVIGNFFFKIQFFLVILISVEINVICIFINININVNYKLFEFVYAT